MRRPLFGLVLTVTLVLTPFFGDAHAPKGGRSHGRAVRAAHAAEKDADGAPLPPELQALSSTPATGASTSRAASTPVAASTTPPPRPMPQPERWRRAQESLVPAMPEWLAPRSA